MAQKRQFNEGRRHFKKNKKQKTGATATTEGSNEEVLLHDVRQLLQRSKAPHSATAEGATTDEKGLEIELEIQELSSTGDGLARKHDKVYVVPFTAPGDTVLARVYRTVEESVDNAGLALTTHVLADFVRVLKASPLRTETPKCQYFTQCSGCQFQHLGYSWQLEHKRRIVEKAFSNFSNLPASAIPVVGETIGSPLQYGYRTKLTPHFDGPPNGRRDKRHGKSVTWPNVPPIGFMLKGTRKTMDIEDCPIGTRAVRLGMQRERKRVGAEIDRYQRGATLLLRESTEHIEKMGTKGHSGSEDAPLIAAEATENENDKDGLVIENHEDYIYRKTCITDSKAVSTEYVDNYRFDNPAGSFFQNNNSILPLVTQYIREHILGPPLSETSSQARPKMKNLIDAYCGSGFFTVTLSPLFSKAIGIDISVQSIASATTNAQLNNLPKDSTQFIAADANDLFASLKSNSSGDNGDSVLNFEANETVVVIDPPRKGCDANFIKQLLAFAPARICYVSCNVHTQARDIGMMVGGLDGRDEAAGAGMYDIESLRGFDFFPQTGHVEGVAMLKKRTLT